MSMQNLLDGLNEAGINLLAQRPVTRCKELERSNHKWIEGGPNQRS